MGAAAGGLRPRIPYWGNHRGHRAAFGRSQELETTKSTKDTKKERETPVEVGSWQFTARFGLPVENPTRLAKVRAFYLYFVLFVTFVV
jgi:hypothetical protein